MACFRVDPQKAGSVIQGGLEPVRFGRKALAVVSLYEYRKTSIAAYREVGVAIACAPKGVTLPAWALFSLFGSLDKGVVGFNVIDLPVTTAAACAARREIWSYPRFVTPIGFDLRNGAFAGDVAYPDETRKILTFSCQAGPGVRAPLLYLIFYSAHKGMMLRTLVNTRGKGQFCLPGLMRLEVSDSQHPMAQRLIALGLEDAKPASELQLRANSGLVLP
ncbi:acetoacetate decarboxylase family protein [uncultured Rhodoblastus sp.]|uniref:acetoacetate decarboxylase family protein n=1 Tax=uncultured Rhodoblastus sp. TaxID=543037 RepID=UPI0025F87A05|nr:acetoacetate decarboxylase family protein [uncultured Rhodoblastus sp.]